MAEWTKAQHWKCCVGATSPRVRIPLSPPFFCLKKWRTKPQGFSSLREAQLHSKNEVFSSHLHKNRESLLVKSFAFAPLVKSLISFACEAAASGGWMCYCFKAHLRCLNRLLWRSEDASFLFTVRSTTSLKRRSLFFTSSPNSARSLACEDVRFAHL